ncbi:hypothetical protein F5888DRAFT_1636505 [Russula emetica]|nr:hypothetical protein F5888DRAFT_1636505 [Russula emetica]
MYLITLFGTTDNYNTEYTKQLHINFAKDAYRATNHRDEYPQMTLWLERHEKIQHHVKYLKWHLKLPIVAPQTELYHPQLTIMVPHSFERLSYLALDCLGHSTRCKSNVQLKILKDTFKKMISNRVSPLEKAFLKSFPTNIRVARKLLEILKTIAYDKNGVLTYPYECTSEWYCVCGGCDLLKLGSTPDRKGISVPKRPFVMQDFHDFVGRLLSRPGIKIAIQQSGEQACDNVVKDIVTADGIKAIKGPSLVATLLESEEGHVTLPIKQL